VDRALDRSLTVRTRAIARAKAAKPLASGRRVVRAS
jgi:hypothetical protein